jgi:hypothetical protein
MMSVAFPKKNYVTNAAVSVEWPTVGIAGSQASLAGIAFRATSTPDSSILFRQEGSYPAGTDCFPFARDPGASAR